MNSPCKIQFQVQVSLTLTLKHMQVIRLGDSFSIDYCAHSKSVAYIFLQTLDTNTKMLYKYSLQNLETSK